MASPRVFYISIKQLIRAFRFCKTIEKHQKLHECETKCHIAEYTCRHGTKHNKVRNVWIDQNAIMGMTLESACQKYSKKRHLKSVVEKFKKKYSKKKKTATIRKDYLYAKPIAEYCVSKGYLEVHFKQDDKCVNKWYFLTAKGKDFVDDMFVPGTYIGFLREFYFEHKIIARFIITSLSLWISAKIGASLIGEIVKNISNNV